MSVGKHNSTRQIVKQNHGALSLDDDDDDDDDDVDDNDDD